MLWYTEYGSRLLLSCFLQPRSLCNIFHRNGGDKTAFTPPPYCKMYKEQPKSKIKLGGAFEVALVQYDLSSVR